jgi:outer membrane protein assembly factor BamB
MQTLRNKTAIIFSTLLILSIAASMAMAPNSAQVVPPAGTHIPTYAYLNVAPNPAGVGQTVTINFFLATPMETSERPTNMRVIQTNPDGTNVTLGPFTGDTTGGSYTTFVPDHVGEWKFQFIYDGQVLTGTSGYAGLINDPSISLQYTLVVQDTPIERSSYPITPLPTQWWETPVTAENVQNWYKITGPWLGLGVVSFGATGSYNASSFCNPYTPSVLSGHVLWTKVWASGGVAGGDAGGSEDTGHYWSTRQYQPQYAPVIINGIMYSQTFDICMGTNMGSGIQAVNLYTGETMYTINTTNTLRCGMVTNYHQINQYGAIGPFIWTNGQLPASDTGGSRPNLQAGTTQWNMYDALNGQYIMSIVNGSALTLRPDESGNLIGYFINNTAGTEMTHPVVGQNVLVTNTGPHISCVNMTMAIGQTGGSWQIAKNTVRSMDTGIMWSVPLPNNISGATISPSLAISSIMGDAVFMTGGFVHGQGVGGETAGWLVIASIDANTGQFLMSKNLTYTGGDTALLPWTRTSFTYGEGLFFIMNDVNYATSAYNARTGTKVWSYTLTGENGAEPNHYDLFSLKPYVANGQLYIAGLGGDLWAINAHTGALNWYTNTTKLIGSPGIETPYDIWPLWVFNCAGFTNDVAYFPIGHEYNPPLFHGAQMLAINATTGELVWSELGTYIRSTSIAYGIMLSMNAYDNQIYAFGKGPSQTTVSAPAIGVTTATPITITGRITDIAEGSKRHDVAANFPNGLPCVSDASQSKWMEYVYQQQPLPLATQGVSVTISVLDSNNNYRQIGTTTTSDGTYAFVWTPDIAGNFQIIASFDGSNSYYPSSATTYVYASDAPTPVPTAAPVTGLATTSDLMTYLAVGVIAIIIAIAIVGLLILRKHP